MEDWRWFEQLVHAEGFGDKVVLALDAKEGRVATRGWTQTSNKLAVDVARDVSSWPLAAILYTDVAKDGMMIGPNFEQTAKLAQAGKVPVIASGGVGNLDHIKHLCSRGIWGVVDRWDEACMKGRWICGKRLNAARSKFTPGNRRFSHHEGTKTRRKKQLNLIVEK